MILGNRQSPPESLDRPIEQCLQGIRRAQIVIGGGEERLGGELGIGDVGGGDLGAGDVAFNRAAEFCPRDRDPRCRWRSASRSPSGRNAAAAANHRCPVVRSRQIVIDSDSGKQACLRFLNDGERLPVRRLGGGDGLIGDRDLRFQTVELLGSLNTTHQEPRSMSSRGAARFQPLSSLYTAGTGAEGCK